MFFNRVFGKCQIDRTELCFMDFKWEMSVDDEMNLRYYET